MSSFDRKNEVMDPFKYSKDFKLELSALKKLNQFGKKLSDNGEYIFFNGMIFGHDNKKSISIGFIDTKILNELTPMMPHMILIDGNSMYQIMKEGTYSRYEVHDDKIVIYYTKPVIMEETFDLDKFIVYANNKGSTPFDVIVAYKKGWESNMDVYNLYLAYIKTLTSRTEIVEEAINLNYVDEDSKIFKKCKKIMNEIIKSGRLVCEKTLSQEEFIEFTNKDEPTEYKFKSLIDGKDVIVRIMKNVCKTISSTSTVGVKIIDVNEEYSYMVTTVYTTGCLICNIFKIQLF